MVVTTSTSTAPQTARTIADLEQRLERWIADLDLILTDHVVRILSESELSQRDEMFLRRLSAASGAREAPLEMAAALRQLDPSDARVKTIHAGLAAEAARMAGRDQAFLQELAALEPTHVSPLPTAELLKRHRSEDRRLEEIHSGLQREAAAAKSGEVPLQDYFVQQCAGQGEELSSAALNMLRSYLNSKGRLMGFDLEAEAIHRALSIYFEGGYSAAGGPRLATLLARSFAELLKTDNPGKCRLEPLSVEEGAELRARLAFGGNEAARQAYQDLLLHNKGVRKISLGARNRLSREIVKAAWPFDAGEPIELDGFGPEPANPSAEKHQGWLGDQAELASRGNEVLARLKERHAAGRLGPSDARRVANLARSSAIGKFVRVEFNLHTRGVIAAPLSQENLGKIFSIHQTEAGRALISSPYGLPRRVMDIRNSSVLSYSGLYKRSSQDKRTKVALVRENLVDEIIRYKRTRDPEVFISRDELAGLLDVNSASVNGYLGELGRNHPWIKALLEYRALQLEPGAAEETGRRGTGKSQERRTSNYILDWFKLNDTDIREICARATSPVWGEVAHGALARILVETRAVIRNFHDARTDVEILADKGLTSPQIAELSRIACHIHRASKGYRFRGHSFDSALEAATALLLEKYVTGFKIREGGSYQWSTASGHQVDFFLGPVGPEVGAQRLKVFLEVHPVIIANPRTSMSDVGSEAEYLNHLAARSAVRNSTSLSESKQHELLRQLDSSFIDSLASGYAALRRKAVESSLGDERFALSVVQDCDQFFDFLRAIGEANPSCLNRPLCSRNELRAEWDLLVRSFLSLRRAENKLFESLKIHAPEVLALEAGRAEAGQLRRISLVRDDLPESPAGEKLLPFLGVSHSGSGPAPQIVEVFEKHLNSDALCVARGDSALHSDPREYVDALRRNGSETLLMWASDIDLESPEEIAGEVVAFLRGGTSAVAPIPIAASLPDRLRYLTELRRSAFESAPRPGESESGELPGRLLELTRTRAALEQRRAEHQSHLGAAIDGWHTDLWKD